VRRRGEGWGFPAPGARGVASGEGVSAASETVAREVLPNGMTLIVGENPTAPVVALTLLVAVGSRDETVETNGVTALLGRVLLKGTRTRSALEIAGAAEDAGGAIESAADQEYSELRARGLAGHWQTLLGLVHDVATAPTLATEEIERERDALLAQIRGLEDQPFQVANRLLNRAVFGRQGYGLPTSGEAETVRGLARADLARHYEASWTPERMVLSVSGQVRADEVLAEAARLFGGVRRGSRAPGGAPLTARPRATRVEERRPAEQAQVLMGFLAPPIGEHEYVATKVLNALLGGGMSSRLFRVLRDEQGLAYAVGSFYPTRREMGRIVIHIGTAPGNAAAAEAGVSREVDRLQAEPVPEDELVRGRAFLQGSFALDLRGNARQSFYRGFFELLGVGHGFLARYPGLIEAVGSSEVQRVAQRYLVEPAVVVVGP